MNAFIDIQLIQNRRAVVIEDETAALVQVCAQADMATDIQQILISCHWPSLLEYLGFESLFEDFFKFDNQNPLFVFITSTLDTGGDKDLLIQLYDQLFTECLTHIKSLPQINPDFLINQIQDKRQTALTSLRSPLILPLLDHYEKLIREYPSHAMHDLILYLAWDRMCVCLALIFEYKGLNPEIILGLNVLKECILESFQHISSQGRTVPGFFRLMEALYAYEMREENLQAHSEEDWLILCQASQALKDREKIAAMFYIDGAIIDFQRLENMDSEWATLRMFTLEPAKNVEAALSLARYFIKTLKLKMPEWHYALRPIEVVCLKLDEKGYAIDKICHN